MTSKKLNSVLHNEIQTVFQEKLKVEEAPFWINFIKGRGAGQLVEAKQKIRNGESALDVLEYCFN